jgi:hypothetical protein
MVAPPASKHWEIKFVQFPPIPVKSANKGFLESAQRRAYSTARERS